MLSLPLVAVSTTQPASSVDHSVIWSVLITQLVALFIFAATIYFGRRSDRDKRARDTKRDVLLEVAPAIQRVYASLAELINPLTPIDKIAEKWTNASGAVAKLQAVANDETLEAARKLVTTSGCIMFRMMAKRVEVGTDLEATKQLIEFWRTEVEVFPDLLADFSAKARNEIPLPLDKKMFSDGFKASNKVIFAEMDNLFEALAKQQSGATRESQAGRAIEDREQTTKPQPADNDAIPIGGGAQLTPAQIAAISAQFVELRQQATFWEYRYLNQFLVHRTQVVLDWLIDRQIKGQTTTRGYCDAELAARVVSPGERAAVFQALEAHALINTDNGLLLVTDKGLDYARWRGPLSSS